MPEPIIAIPEFMELGLLNQLADAMPQLVWIATPDGTVVYYNNRVSEFAGAYLLPDGAWSWDGLLHPEDKEPTEKAWSEAVRNGTVYEIEHRVHMQDGSFKWHLSRAFPQKNNLGRIVRWFGTATNIHEQKLVEEKVKEAEERWRTALEATRMGTWDYHPLSGTLFLSERARKIVGITGEGDLVAAIRQAIHPEDLSFVTEHLLEALAAGKEQTLSLEYRILVSGSVRWIRTVGRISVGAQGNPQRVIGMTQDITQKKEAETKLQYLATLTRNIPDAVIGTDMEHRIITWNRGAETMYGWLEEEVRGRMAREILQTRFYSDHDQAEWPAHLEKHGWWRGEVIQKRKDGSDITVLVSISNVRDHTGRQIGGVGVNKDITEQRKAAQHLKESEERFRVLTNTIPQIVWVSGQDGELEYINDQWSRITGLPIYSEREHRTEAMHPDDVPSVHEKWARGMREGKDIQLEYRLKMKDTGEYRWFFANIQPLRNKEGVITRWIGTATDIQHFKDISVLLEQQVRERTMELNQVNSTLQKQAEELKRSNEDLQQFAHVASHDLKEPLRKIKTYGSRLEDEFGGELPAKAREYLKKMQSAAGRMSSMIDGVLHYSLLTNADQNFESVNLDQLLAQIEHDLELVIQQKNAQIRYHQLPEVRGSVILLYQLFYNLLNNSLKFSRPGTDTLIEIDAAEISHTDAAKQAGLPDDRSYVSVSLRDNGIGFEPDQAEQIFRTFTRLHSKDKYEGTGLGLALCKKIVERHEGMITASGTVNGGAVFTILLPLP